jgi:hypothetical protein
MPRPSGTDRDLLGLGGRCEVGHQVVRLTEHRVDRDVRVGGLVLLHRVVTVSCRRPLVAHHHIVSLTGPVDEAGVLAPLESPLQLPRPAAIATTAASTANMTVLSSPSRSSFGSAIPQTSLSAAVDDDPHRS